MDNELEDLKRQLRSLAVSSPVQLDVQTLLRDFRELVGPVMPIAKWGYRDPVLFLKERCTDCFLFSGPMSNPHLTLIVKESTKHIDKLVQKQKLSNAVKFKGKRTSVPESSLKPNPTLIADTFAIVKNQPQNSQINHSSNKKYNNKENREVDSNVQEPKKHIDRNVKVNGEHYSETYSDDKNVKEKKSVDKHIKINGKGSEETYKNFLEAKSNDEKYIKANNKCSAGSLENSFERSSQPSYLSVQAVTTTSKSRKTSEKEEIDSGRQTASSSGSSSKQAKIEKLKSEILELLSEYPNGLLCRDLIRLYRERHKRELAFPHLGYTSILSLVYDLGMATDRPQAADDWLVFDPRVATPARRPGADARAPRQQRARKPNEVDPEDALPGIQYDPDVFPADCVHLAECIQETSVAGLAPGAMLEVVLGEVYSPSHFWLIRLGDRFSIAMDEIMDEMTQYYTYGEGKDRHLALGAVKPGQYCASVYDGDYHRSVIVKIIDSDTVKVRHVDYATVETQSVYRLKPLLRRWAALPAQALRARLAGVRPSAGGRRWPYAASAFFLSKVNNKKLVASVLAVEFEENLIEVILVDTSTEDDICIGSELIKAGHADGRADSALRTSESYLYPQFEALETGATPNYGEIHKYLSHGIALEYVDDYRRHVPSCVPAGSPPLLVDDDPSPPAPPTFPSPPPQPQPSPPLALINRVPLQSLASPSPPSALPSYPERPPSTGPVPIQNDLLNNTPPHSVESVNDLNRMNPAMPVGRPESTSTVNNVGLSVPMSLASPPAYPGWGPRPAYPTSPTSPNVRLPFPTGGPLSPPVTWDLQSPAVVLPLADYEIYRVLSTVNPQLACKFIADALERSIMRQGTGSRRAVNPHAPDLPGMFPSPPPPPPGFGK